MSLEPGCNARVIPGDGRADFVRWTSRREATSGYSWVARSVQDIRGSIVVSGHSHGGISPWEMPCPAQACRPSHDLKSLNGTAEAGDRAAADNPVRKGLDQAKQRPRREGHGYQQLGDGNTIPADDISVAIGPGTSPSMGFLSLGTFCLLFADSVDAGAWAHLLRNVDFYRLLVATKVFTASPGTFATANLVGVFDICRPELLIVRDTPIEVETIDSMVPYHRAASGKWIFEDDELLSCRHVLSSRRDRFVRFLVDEDGSWTAETDWKRGKPRNLN